MQPVWTGEPVRRPAVHPCEHRTVGTRSQLVHFRRRREFGACSQLGWQGGGKPCADSGGRLKINSSTVGFYDSHGYAQAHAGPSAWTLGGVERVEDIVTI